MRASFSLLFSSEFASSFLVLAELLLDKERRSETI
jgi:hypothetical protein